MQQSRLDFNAPVSALVTRAPPPASLRVAASVAGLSAIPLGLALIGVRGLDMLSLAPAALWTARPWEVALAAPVAVTVPLAVTASLLAATAAWARGQRPRLALSLVACGLGALSFAVSGHAAAAPPRLPSGPAVALHAVALIFWMGALLPLLASLRAPGATVPLRRFSALAVPLVALLVVHTGQVMADIRLTPGRVGPVEVAPGFQTGDFAELVPQEVEIVFAQPAAGIQPIRLTALPGGDGLWHVGPVTLPRPGDWGVTLRLFVPDLGTVTLTETLTLPD